MHGGTFLCGHWDLVIDHSKFRPPALSRRPFLYNQAMPSLNDSLRTLHRIHRQLSDLRDRLERGPKATRAAEGAVTKSEADLTQAKDAYKQVKMAADEKQLQ